MGSTHELITISIGLVAAHFEGGKEAFYSFFESDMVSGEFITIEIVLEVSWRETMPVHHC